MIMPRFQGGISGMARPGLPLAPRGFNPQLSAPAPVAAPVMGPAPQAPSMSNIGVGNPLGRLGY